MFSSRSAACGRWLGLRLASSALLILAAWPAWAAEPADASAARFEAALPGYKVARILWREGKLVLEHEGSLVVLRQGDALPKQPLIRLMEIGERAAVLREASVAPAAGEGAAVPLMPERLIRLTPAAAGASLSGDGYSVVILTAAAPPAPIPQLDAPLSGHQVTPDGGGVPTDGKDHQAPLVPATRQGGGGGR